MISGNGSGPASGTVMPAARTKDTGSLAGWLGKVVGVALTAVITAPLALSSYHILEWAREDVTGLGLPDWLAWVVILALDATAVVCVGMVTIAALRGEKAGGHHLMTWLVAGASALANLVYGWSTPAMYDEWAFPGFSLLGPLLLDLTLALLRRWHRIDNGLRQKAAKVLDFGITRWMPWVATGETFAAWQVAQREGIERPEEAIARVREMRQLSWMPAADALRYAFSALGSRDPYAARTWLAARGVRVTQDDVDVALTPRDVVEMVLAAPDGMTAAEVARRRFGSVEQNDVERARRLLDAFVPHQLTRDGSPRGGRGKAVRYRSAVAAIEPARSEI